MELFFSPLACSMAARIALYEAGAMADFIEVDPRTKRTHDGLDYLTVNPLGLVPALRTDSGDVLVENAAVLQWIADRHPAANLAPTDGLERARLQQWLCFIGTELHKGLFIPLFDAKLAPDAKQIFMEKGMRRLDYLDSHLIGRSFLLDRFSVADAYLVTVLNWKIAVPVDLDRWPAIATYFARLTTRPGIARALSEEHALYAAETKGKR